MTAEDFKQEAENVRPLLDDIAQRYLHNKEDAEDVVQDVLVKLWAMLDDLHRPIGALARVLTRNLCIDHIRRHPILLELDSAKVQTVPPPNPQNEMIERMMSVVEHLPPKQQLILRLRHMNGMSITEISQLTGDSEANVRKILSRARLGVRALYGKSTYLSNKQNQGPVKI